MPKRTSAFAFVTLIASAVVGAWLLGLFEGEHAPKEVSRADLLLSLFGFFLLLGSLIGIVLVIRQNMRPISQGELVMWKTISKGGRRNYIKKVVLRGGVYGLFIWSVLGLYNYLQHGLDRNDAILYPVMFLITVFAFYYVALRTWAAHEDALRRSRTREGSSSQTSAE